MRAKVTDTRQRLTSSPLLSIKETAESGRTGMTEFQIRQRVREGRCPCIRSGRKVLVDVEGLIDQIKREARGDM